MTRRLVEPKIQIVGTCSLWSKTFNEDNPSEWLLHILTLEHFLCVIVCNLSIDFIRWHDDYSLRLYFLIFQRTCNLSDRPPIIKAY